MDVLLKNIFPPVPELAQISSVEIALRMKRFILNNSLPAGTAIFAKDVLVKYLGVPKVRVDDAFSQLEKDDHLIDHCHEKRARVVPVLPKKYQKSQPVMPVKNNVSHGRQFFFNLKSVGFVDPGTKGLVFKLRRSCDVFNAKNYHHKENDINQLLIAEMRARLNHSLGTNYAQNELIYSNDERFSIYQICATHLAARAVFVMAKPFPEHVNKSVLALGRGVKIIGADQEGMLMTELEELCSVEKVGVVFISSRAHYPFHHQLSLSRIHDLVRLARLYKFTIIEHDPYAPYFENCANLFMETIHGLRLNVIYHTSFSLISPASKAINIIAGPPKLISPITHRLVNTGTILSGAMANALHDMLKNEVFQKYEVKVNKGIKQINQIAREVLKEEGDWELEGISTLHGWHLYLKPVKGNLPENAYSTLEKLGIHVVDPDQYSDNSYKNGIMISIVSYINDKRLVRDLKVLTQNLREMIF